MNNSTFYTGNALTDVGAFRSAASYYGTFDQGGNVWERIDADIGSGSGSCGGSWFTEDVFLGKLFGRVDFGLEFEDNTSGFRVAIVPEPGVVGLMGLGALLLLRKRKD